MYQILLVLHVIVAVILVGFILLQQGRGAQTGAAFGSGASTTIFGSQGSAGFLSRATWFLAVTFFVVNLCLAYLTNKVLKGEPLQEFTGSSQVAPDSEIPTGSEGEQATTPAQGSSDIPGE